MQVVYLIERIEGGGRRPSLEECGLGYLLPGSVSWRPASPLVHGERRTGWLMGVAGHHLDAAGTEWQEWPRVEGGCRVWTGVRAGGEACEDLLRQGAVGVEVRMGDGREWLFPRAWAWASGEDAPVYIPACNCKHELTEDGRWLRRAPAGRERELLERALDVLAQLESGGAALLDPGMVAELLGETHRVGPAEVSALGLLDDDVVVRAMRSWVDLDGYLRVAAAKKKAAGGGDANGGRAAAGAEE